MTDLVGNHETLTGRRKIALHPDNVMFRLDLPLNTGGKHIPDDCQPPDFLYEMIKRKRVIEIITADALAVGATRIL
jgi:hypothetical protein